ncbi:MAG: FAD-dependent oxidoreductase [Ruminococcaceae bacterium]|nr:FAD-dependent oxidoreductase [Oscillospiraceae bacterium]
MVKTDVLVIGGGPAGLAAAISAKKEGADVILVEREARLGGILKQCIHDGFGLVRYGEKLSGPEYAERFIGEFLELKIKAKLLTFVTSIEKNDKGFKAALVSKEGIEEVQTKSLILATGCRERTSKQVFIHGTRPAGIFTAGTAQHFTNLLGQLPTKRCVILGSGDIGLIMARRLTLEGAKVLGVYEVKPTPSGLTRNIHQCLYDFDIPLYLSHTVTRVFGDDRLTAVEVVKVDEKMQVISGTEEIVECDALILSVGLIPENEIAEDLDVEIDPKTKGPKCDTHLMTSVPGIFSCGNALHVSDLVDYVSESGETAGKYAAHFALQFQDADNKNISSYTGVLGDGKLVDIEIGDNILYFVPQSLNLETDLSSVIVYFRSKDVFDNSKLKIKVDGKVVFEKKYAFLRPPEMEKLKLDFASFGITDKSLILAEVEVGVSE